MGILEWLSGWEYVGNTLKTTIKVDGKYYADPRKLINRIHPYIIKTLDKGVEKNISHQAKRWLRKNKGHAPLGRTLRGVKNMPNFTGIGYATGKHFKYKGKETHYYIDNHGHGGAISHGMKIWRKRK